MGIEDSPEFQKALKDVCDSKWRNWLYGGGAKTSKRYDVERDLEKIQQLKNQADMEERNAFTLAGTMLPNLRLHPFVAKPYEDYVERGEKLGDDLICPVCKDEDMGNKVNGVSWCLKCDSQLVPRSKAAKWLRERIKLTGNKVPNKLKGLPDDGDAVK